ncbi:MAG: hypothetical protein HOI95_09865 [Chromatiales bacterium]|nr:hypothetical protein [Chromatiales bacterium]
MDRNELIDNLVREFGLLDHDIYLLDLVPLIEMMWADERSDPVELSLIYEFAIAHLAKLDADSGGIEVVTVDDVNRFLNRFAHARPDPRLLDALSQIAVNAAHSDTNSERGAQRRSTMLDYCIDIAAACTSTLAGDERHRVLEAEKRLLRALIRALDIGPTAPDHR